MCVCICVNVYIHIIYIYVYTYVYIYLHTYIYIRPELLRAVAGLESAQAESLTSLQVTTYIDV